MAPRANVAIRCSSPGSPRSRLCGPRALPRIGELSAKELLIAGTALYAGEGAKTDGRVKFANSDPRMIWFFVMWLRRCFVVDERRLRFGLYLHEGLDLRAATAFWSALTDIPRPQFTKPYRAVPDSSIRSNKHPMGCADGRLLVLDHPPGDHGADRGAAIVELPFRGSSTGRAVGC